MSRYLIYTGVDLPEILDTTAEATLIDHPDAVVHFWAKWNRHDRTMARSIAANRGRFAGQVAFFACNIDQADAGFLVPLGILNIPALAHFHHGITGETRIGVLKSDELASWIEARLAEAF